MDKLFDIIHEDDELLVINKPADLVCHPTKGDEYSSLISRVRLHLGADAKPHLVNRLDRETSGVTMVAKTAAVAGELGKLWESRTVQKEYVAIVHGHVREEHGLIDAALGKDVASIVAIKDCVRTDGAASQTEYRVERRIWKRGNIQHSTFNSEHSTGAPDVPEILILTERGCGEAQPQRVETRNSLIPDESAAAGLGDTAALRGKMRIAADVLLDVERSMLNVECSPRDELLPFTLLRLLPRTGRKHQIRIHLAHIGHPLVGDKIYGGDVDLYLALVEGRLTEAQRARLILPNHALHASALRFEWRGRAVEFRCEPEGAFREFVAG